jgi:hypothetical protein
MLNSHNLVFNFSHISQVSFFEFVIDGHHYTSPNQQKQPRTLSFSDSESLPDDVSPTQLRKRVWALHHSLYLPFILNSPFRGSMTCRFATPPELIPLEEDMHGYHLPTNVAKSRKTLEQSCFQIATVPFNLKIFLNCSIPRNISHFGYFIAHSTEKKVRSLLNPTTSTCMGISPLPIPSLCT